MQPAAGMGALEMSALRKMGLIEDGRQNNTHAYRNACQSLILMEHAQRAGLRRTFDAGLRELAAIEGAIRAYRPEPWEAEEHSEMIHLIKKLRSLSSSTPLPAGSSPRLLRGW
jgi:hypothetical protein